MSALHLLKTPDGGENARGRGSAVTTVVEASRYDGAMTTPPPSRSRVLTSPPLLSLPPPPLVGGYHGHCLQQSGAAHCSLDGAYGSLFDANGSRFGGAHGSLGYGGYYGGGGCGGAFPHGVANQPVAVPVTVGVYSMEQAFAVGSATVVDAAPSTPPPSLGRGGGGGGDRSGDGSGAPSSVASSSAAPRHGVDPESGELPSRHGRRRRKSKKQRRSSAGR